MENDFTKNDITDSYEKRDIPQLKLFWSMRYGMVIDIIGMACMLTAIKMGYKEIYAAGIFMGFVLFGSVFVIKAMFKPDCPECGGKMTKKSILKSTCDNCCIEWKLPQK